MPDASGRFAGQGWSRKKEAAWERVFGRPETTHCCSHQAFNDLPCYAECSLLAVPPEPPHEDLDERADRDEAAGWGR